MKRRWIRVVAWGIGALLILTAIATAVLTLGRRQFVKDAVVNVLEQHFHSTVEIRSLRVWIFPRVYAVAEGITLRQWGRTDVPPLFIADKLTVTADLHALIEKPIRVANVQITGLQLHLPPREDNAKSEAEHAESQPKPKKQLPVVISEIDTDETTLVMLPKDPKKIPLQFDIHHMVMNNAGGDEPSTFHATLRNPKPVGDIDTKGHFGPWNADEPSQTHVDGDFSFSHADLGTLKGIKGILSSQGTYDGELDALNVQGDTDTPDFALQFSEKPVDLKTHYIAVVDGTNGNTYLKSVTAHFLHSTIQTNGEVVKVRGAKHRHVTLNATAKNARMEDILHLVIKGDQEVMSGSTDLDAKIDIPPDDVTLFDKLIIKGKFGIAGVHFANSGVQGKVDSLSRHGQGEPKNLDITDVVSNLDGEFGLQDKVATFSNLTFDVEGAKVQLAGTYKLDDETMDFRGHLLLNAQLSQLTTGVKSVFLKPFDPFFKKNGAGTSLPIRITGTRTNPSFGLDFNDKKDKRDKGKSKPKS
jgi:AsmA-like C-terminal region